MFNTNVVINCAKQTNYLEKENFMNLPSDADHTGRNFDLKELELLKKVIESGTLNCTKGTVVKEFEKRFAEMFYKIK